MALGLKMFQVTLNLSKNYFKKNLKLHPSVRHELREFSSVYCERVTHPLPRNQSATESGATDFVEDW